MASSVRPSGSRDRAPRAALTVFLLTGTGYLAAQYLETGNRPYTANFANTSGDTVFATITFGLAVLGLFLLTFHPGHRTGWLLLGFGFGISSALLTHALAVRLLLVDQPPHWLGELFAWISTWIISAALALVLFIPATVPSGRIQARWLRQFAVAAAVAAVTLVVGQAFAPDSLDGLVAPATIDNPLGIAVMGEVVVVTTTVSVLVLLAFFIASVVDLVLRSARTSGRGLVLVFVVAGLVAAALIGVAVGPVLGNGGWLAVVLVLALVGIAATTALAARAEQRRTAAEDDRTRLVAEREDERRRLRADLHDGLGPLMAALGLELDAEDGAASRVRARSLLDEAIREIRRISRNLRPATLDELGLVGALRRQATALTEAGGPTFDVVTTPEQLPALSASLEVAVFRIAGEAMTNAARHSGASRCEVRLDASAEDGSFHLEIDDDGTGLDRSHPAGLGLQTMHVRADELGGHVAVGPGPDGGTRVVAVLPVTA